MMKHQKSEQNTIYNQIQDIISTVKKSSIYLDIEKQKHQKAAWDELFFLSAFKMINPEYVFTDNMICYTKWFDWVSKHPTIFNRLLSTDKDYIDANDSCFFIRKTFPTFINEVITKKDNCIIIVIGTENKNIPDYNNFRSKYQDNSDIFLLVMIDNMSEIKSSDIKEACCQCYFVLWNMVKDASNKLMDIMKNELKYNNVVIIPEGTDANQFISDKLVLEPQNELENAISTQPEWIVMWSTKHNRKYWFNNKTNESSWTEPTNIKTTDSEWVEKWSDRHNRKYWFNNKTNKSTWEDPAIIKKGGKKKIRTIKKYRKTYKTKYVKQ